MRRGGAAELRRRLPSLWAVLGGEGLMMFVLVNVALTLSLGGLFALALFRVARVAITAPANAPGAGATLVLGARVSGNRPSPEFRRRLDRAAVNRGSGRIFVLGGRPRGEELAEAIVGRDYLIQRGVPSAAIVAEAVSRNTLENLVAAQSLLEQRQGSLPAALITSRFHLARASLIARSLGIDHLPCAAEDRLPRDFRTIGRVARESYFVLCHGFDDTLARLVDRASILHRLAANYRREMGLPIVEP